MATFSSEELARKVLAIYGREQSSGAGHVLSRQDLLAQWPKGFTHVELTTDLQYACSKGWLAQKEAGFELTPAGMAEPQSFIGVTERN